VPGEPAAPLGQVPEVGGSGVRAPLRGQPGDDEFAGAAVAVVLARFTMSVLARPVRS